jgi:hypothetical protein
MIRREVMEKIKLKPLHSKFDAYLFESGKSGLTRQVENMGYRALVIGLNGVVYDVNNCMHAGTFWCGLQENLLVSDNQTDIYDQSDAIQKASLTLKAWGHS